MAAKMLLVTGSPLFYVVLSYGGNIAAIKLLVSLALLCFMCLILWR